jgi:hypothetical protein
MIAGIKQLAQSVLRKYSVGATRAQLGRLHGLTVRLNGLPASAGDYKAWLEHWQPPKGARVQ